MITHATHLPAPDRIDARTVECATYTQVDSADVVKRLLREGWKLARQRGSHRLYTHSKRNGRVTVPHPRKEIPTGTLRNIYRQAGWPWKERP